MNWVTVRKMSELSGYTQKAVYNKIEKGIWLLDRHYRKAPDGRLLLSISAIEDWAQGI